jgi:hypothetical protein
MIRIQTKIGRTLDRIIWDMDRRTLPVGRVAARRAS